MYSIIHSIKCCILVGWVSLNWERTLWCTALSTVSPLIQAERWDQMSDLTWPQCHILAGQVSLNWEKTWFTALSSVSHSVGPSPWYNCQCHGWQGVKESSFRWADLVQTMGPAATWQSTDGSNLAKYWLQQLGKVLPTGCSNLAKYWLQQLGKVLAAAAWQSTAHWLQQLRKVLAAAAWQGTGCSSLAKYWLQQLGKVLAAASWQTTAHRLQQLGKVLAAASWHKVTKGLPSFLSHCS